LPTSETDWKAKYLAKFDPTVIGARATAMAALAVTKANVHITAMSANAATLRGLLNTAGVLPMDSVKYISFSNKLYSLCVKSGGAGASLTATNQATLEGARWNTDYGADPIVLKQIWNMYQAVLGTAPSPFPS
jgi:hypothetical protein